MVNILEFCFHPEDERPSSDMLSNHIFLQRSDLWTKYEWRQMKTWWPPLVELPSKENLQKNVQCKENIDLDDCRRIKSYERFY